MKRWLLFLLCSFIITLGAQEIQVQNRILAKANGKPITLIDLVKKMDVVFYRQFPQYAEVGEARLQFYRANWSAVLQELIDKELILADASALQMQVSDVDVRRELEETFGANVFATLDKLQLDYDDVWDMLKEEIIIRRMILYRVNTKAAARITPQKILSAYEDYVAENAKTETWRYRVISFRGSDETQCKENASKAFDFFSKHGLEDVESKLELDPSITWTVSDEFAHDRSEISENYRDALASLSPGQFSYPCKQKSRRDDQSLFRIFHLVKRGQNDVQSLATLEKEIQNRLLDQATEDETSQYFSYLESHFDVEELIPEDFSPF